MAHISLTNNRSVHRIILIKCTSLKTLGTQVYDDATTVVPAALNQRKQLKKGQKFNRYENLLPTGAELKLIT